MFKSVLFCQRRLAFTLMELLVVIGIISILLGLLLPAVQASRETARANSCLNNLKQTGLAIQNFESQRMELPPSRNYDHYTSWAFLILPYMEQQALPDAWDDKAKYYYQSDTARLTPISMYYCPSRRSDNLISTDGDDILSPYEVSNHVPGTVGDYACSAGHGPPGIWNWIHSNGAMIMGIGTTEPKTVPEGNFAPPGAILVSWKSRTNFASIIDGTSQTILIGEKHVRPMQQGIAPEDGALYNGDHPGSFSRCGGPGYPLARFPDDEYQNNFGSYHAGGGVNFAFADGSVRTITPDISTDLLGRLTARNDSEVVVIP
jgi:prepilin-type processing-associated H-X9-DG protein/prepilin-type N-terminal cleavage/methylation domain-containing protein